MQQQGESSVLSLRPGGGGGGSRFFVPRFVSSSSSDLTNGGGEETTCSVRVNIEIHQSSVFSFSSCASSIWFHGSFFLNFLVTWVKSSGYNEGLDSFPWWWIEFWTKFWSFGFRFRLLELRFRISVFSFYTCLSSIWFSRVSPQFSR